MLITIYLKYSISWIKQKHLPLGDISVHKTEYDFNN